MAKKRQTTGLPKRRNEQQPEAVSGGKPLKEFKTRAERESEIQRYVVYGVVAALAVVVVIIAAALIVDQFINPSRTVASVNGVEISQADFEDRVRFERLVTIEQINTTADQLMQEQGLTEVDAANQALQFDPTLSELWEEFQNSDRIGLRVLNDMIEDQLILAEAETRGITVTNNEIEAQIDDLLGFDAEANRIALDPELTPEPEPSNTPTPTPFVSPTPSPTPTETSAAEGTPDADAPPAAPTIVPTVSSAATREPQIDRQVFENNREAFFELAQREANYSEEEVMDYFRIRAIRAKLSTEVTDATDTEVWVNSRRIVVETEEEAQAILEALQNGESFSAIASASSLASSAARGGEEGALPIEDERFADFYDEDFLAALQTAEVGELVGPVPASVTSQDPNQGTINGFQIIQVRSREDRDLIEEAAELRQAQAFEEWLTELRNAETNDIERSDFWPEIVPLEPAYFPRSAR